MKMYDPARHGPIDGDPSTARERRSQPTHGGTFRDDLARTAAENAPALVSFRLYGVQNGVHSCEVYRRADGTLIGYIEGLIGPRWFEGMSGPRWRAKDVTGNVRGEWHKDRMKAAEGLFLSAPNLLDN